MAHPFRRRFSAFPLFQFALVELAMLALMAGAADVRAQSPGPQASHSGSISGTVVDPFGARVSSATVTLLRNGQPLSDAQTDADGRFSFPRVSPGRYQLVARTDQLVSRARDPLLVGPNAALVVDLRLQVGLQEQTVVTAAATEALASQVGASVTVIDEAVLQDLGTPDALEALRLVPGTAVVRAGGRGSVAAAFVRGGASNFSKILVDDVPANDIGGAFDFADLATAGIDRLETLREANSVLYGSDALAGVISLTTRKGRTRVPEAMIAVDGGNFHTDREELSAGGAVRRLHYFADFFHLGTDNQVPNNAYSNKTLAARVGWTPANGMDLGATVRTARGSLGVPNAFDLYGIADDSSQTTEATFVSATFRSLVGSRWQTTARFGWMDQFHRSVNPSPTGEPFDPFESGFPNYLGQIVTLVGANGYQTTGQAILDYSAAYPQEYQAGASRGLGTGQATGRLTGWLDLSAGGRIEHEAGHTIFAGSRSTTSRTNAGAFGELRLSLPRAFVTGGLGYDHNAIFKSAVTPRVSAAVYARSVSSGEFLGDTKAMLNAGTGIKAPSIAQELSSLFALVQQVAARPSSSSASLSPIGPERSRSFDVGVEQNLWSSRARVRASFFHNAFSDLIEYVSASALPQLGIPPAVAAATGFGAYVNASSYTARGLEASGEVALGRFLRVAGSYTHLRAVVNESFASSALDPAFNPAFPGIPIGAYGPLVGAAPFRRPANLGTLLLGFTRDRVQLALAGAFAGRSDDSTFVSDGFFGYGMLLPNHDLNGAYQKMDLSGSYRIHRRLRWYLTLENLLNQRYATAFGYPALTRSVRTGVAATIGGDGRRP